MQHVLKFAKYFCWEYSASGDWQAVFWMTKKISHEKILSESLININSKGRSRERKAKDSWEHKTTAVHY